MQIGIRLKHLAHCSAGQCTSRVIHSLYGNMVDEFAMPCPDLEDYYAWERNILFLLSLIMNRFAAGTRGSMLKGILAGCNLDRWCEHCCTRYWKRQVQTQESSTKYPIRWRGLLSIIIFPPYDISVHLWLSMMVKHSCWCSQGINN